jgi:hypothetical protein
MVLVVALAIERADERTTPDTRLRPRWLRLPGTADGDRPNCLAIWINDISSFRKWNAIRFRCVLR